MKIPEGWQELSLDEVKERFGSWGRFPINDRHKIIIAEDGVWHFLKKIRVNEDV